MYKVVLLDDENRIIRGLKVIIDWEKYDCEIIGEASNGIDGIELIKRTQPDIVITDIRMPKMDGLQMVQSLKEKDYSPEVIILSGYSEFEYAKKGMELGINCYILKPVEVEEMEACLTKLCKKLMKKKIKNREMIEFKTLALRDVIDGSTDNRDEIIDLLNISNTKLNETNIVCAIIEINPIYASYINKSMNTLINMVKTYIEGHFQCEVIKYSDLQIAIIVHSSNKIDIENVHTIFNELHNNIEQEHEIRSCIGVGKIVECLSKISLSFEQARYAINYKVINGNNSVIEFEQLCNTKKDIKIPKKIFSDLEKYINNLDIEGCKNTINNFFDMLVMNKRLRPMDIQLQCLLLIISTVKSMKSIQFELNEFIGRDVLSIEEISRFKSIEEIKNWLTNVISSIIELKYKSQNIKPSTIDEIKTYINQHYTENLSLNSIAEHFFFNPYYLSQLFKKKTGESYLNYVTKLRIQKAQQLLNTTNMKIYEICHAIGYENTKYFNKVFQKHIGLKPSEYRKKNKLGSV
ncbi:response regulator transcription factor [Vallitalea guaymasensis]|uniref:response regulator transcription factor n=1 Tax=Vallitalea guaymasensis TaxID=1185412 RepID=UPI00272AA3B3|nr:response regulator transcription factor [Vallitalea guaymasensis]